MADKTPERNTVFQIIKTKRLLLQRIHLGKLSLTITNGGGQVKWHEMATRSVILAAGSALAAHPMEALCEATLLHEVILQGFYLPVQEAAGYRQQRQCAVGGYFRVSRHCGLGGLGVDGMDVH